MSNMVQDAPDVWLTPPSDNASQQPSTNGSAQQPADDWITPPESRSVGDTITGYTHALGSGVNSGIAHLLGLPIDINNLLGEAVAGKGAAWVLDKLGYHDAADAVRKDGFHPAYAGSSQSIQDLANKTPLGYKPQTPGEQTTQNLTSGATTGALLAATTGGLGNLGELTAGSTDALANVGGQALAGATSASGGDLAKGVNDKLAANGGWSLPPPVAEFLGSLLTGGITGGALNRSALYDRPSILDDYKAAGVEPHFPSDVNPNPGPTGKFFSSFLPNRFGARGISQSNAQSTQDQLSDYAKSFLNPGDTSLTKQGTALQQGAADSVAALKQETEAAYTKANGMIDPATPVPTESTRQAIGGLVDQADDADLKKMLQSPMFQKYEPLLGKPFMTWNDMNILRQDIGANIGATQGSEQGLLKQVYKGINQDLQTAAKDNPDALKALNEANATYQTNQTKIDGILDTVQSKELPEALPNQMANQNGATRLNNLFNTPAFNNPTTQGQIGQQLLGNRGMSGGNFNLDNLLKFWQSASPETQQALSLDPDVAQGMQRLLRMYDATGASRGLLNDQHGSWSPSSVLHAVEPYVEGGSAVGGLWTGHPVEAGAAIAAPVAAGAAAGVGQIPAMASLGGPVSGAMLTNGQKLGTSLAGTFADVYEPPPYDTSSAEQHDAQWLGGTDRQTATAYVGSKLGPQVASQLANTDTQGYGAALFQLMSNPQTRNALFGGNFTP